MKTETKPTQKGSSSQINLTDLRAFVATLIANGQVDDALDMVFELLVAMRDENNLKAIRIAKLLKEKFGKSSEKVSRAQLDLFIQSAKALNTDAPNDPADSPLPAPPAPPLPNPPPRKRTGRNPLPSNLPREKRRIEPVATEQRCIECGAQKVEIGTEKSELLEFVPAQFKIIEIERVKMACKSCAGEVVIAPVPDKPIEQGRPGPGLLAHVVVSKFDDHQPLYRLSGIYQRHGVFIPDSTLGTWVGVVADWFQPIHRRLGELVLLSYVLGVDDTPLKVLDRDHAAGVRRGHLWAYVGYDNLVPVRVVYRYTPTWEKEGPISFLKDRRGYIQGDGYPGTDTLFQGEEPRATRVGCWAHVRRKYKDALDVPDLRAAEPLKLIGLLYDTERLANAQNALQAQRKQLRDEYSKPAVAALWKWAARNQPWVEPKSPLLKAINYTINQWDSLLVYLEDGAIPIDNNRVEQRMRPVAVGRRNYLFAGSDAGAERAAILYTVMAGCKLANINPFDYVRDVLERLSSGWPASRLDELLPENWQSLSNGIA